MKKYFIHCLINQLITTYRFEESKNLQQKQHDESLALQQKVHQDAINTKAQELTLYL